MASETFAGLIPLDESAEEVLGESAFTKLISLHEGGYWIEPTGRIIPTDNHGADAVEILGLEYPKVNGDRYDSEIMAEFDSEAVYMALERGWVRIEDENFSYAIQVLRWGKREKELIYDFFKDHGNLNNEVEVWIEGKYGLPEWSGTVGDIRHNFFNESIRESAWVKPDGTILQIDYRGNDSHDHVAANAMQLTTWGMPGVDPIAIALSRGWIRVLDDGSRGKIIAQVGAWGEHEKDLLYDYVGGHRPAQGVEVWIGGTDPFKSGNGEHLIWSTTVGDIRTKFFGESKKSLTDQAELGSKGMGHDHVITKVGKLLGESKKSFAGLFADIRETAKISSIAALDRRFPVAGSHVSGLRVTNSIPNTESISATLYDYEVLRGVREVHMSEMDPSYVVQPYAANDVKRNSYLVNAIKDNGWIDPLIVVVDDERYPYVLEGGHRYDALCLLKIKSFPALVVIDTDVLEIQESAFVSLLEQVRVPVTGIWWLDSHYGKVIPVRDEHAVEIVEDPSVFGLTEEQVEAEDTNQGVLRLAYSRGWIRGISNSARIFMSGYKSPSTLSAIVELAAGVHPEVELVIDWDNGVAQPATIYRNKFLVGSRPREFLAGDVVRSSSILESQVRLHEGFEGLLESALVEGMGYWLTDKGDIKVGEEKDAVWGESPSSGVTNSHTSYLRNNKLFSGDRFGVALRRGWIAARNIYGNEWSMVVDKLDSRTKDRIWDWARGQEDHSSKVYIYNRKGSLSDTTVGRIVNDFDFGDGDPNIQEAIYRADDWANLSRMPKITKGGSIGEFWINSRNGEIVDAPDGHGRAVDDAASTFGVYLDMPDYNEDDDDRNEAYDEHIQALIVAALEKGWVRVEDELNTVGIECLKTRYSRDTIIELCSKLDPATRIIIDWQPTGGSVTSRHDITRSFNLQTTAGEITKDSSILESATFSNAGRITEDFDFGDQDHTIRENAEDWDFLRRMPKIPKGLHIGEFWINSRSGRILDAPDGHGGAVRNNPHTFGLDDYHANSSDLSLVAFALLKGWVRIEDEGDTVGIECIKNRYTRDTIIELCSNLDPSTYILIDWLGGGRSIKTTAGDIAQDSSILESATFSNLLEDLGFIEERSNPLLRDFWVHSKSGLRITVVGGHEATVVYNPVFGWTGGDDLEETDGEPLQFAVSKGWIRVNVGSTNIDFQCQKTQACRDTIIELCSELPRHIEVLIDWWPYKTVHTTVKDILGDSSILESATFSNLLEDLGSVEEGAHDQIYRQEALKAWDYIHGLLLTSPAKLLDGVKVPGHPGLVVFGILRYHLPSTHYDMGGSFAPRDPNFNGSPSIMLVFDDHSDELSLGDTFMHEFIHYLDALRNPTMSSVSYIDAEGNLDSEKYLSSPAEFNAMYQSAIASIELTIKQAAKFYREKKLPEAGLMEKMYFLRSPKLFATFAFHVTGESSGLPQNASPELRQRIMKRAALDYPRVLSYAKSLGLPFG